MITPLRLLAPLSLAAALSGCADFQNLLDALRQTEPAPEVDAPADGAPLDGRVVASSEVPGADGATAETLDTTTQAERAEATSAAPGSGALLGETIASLGDPAKPGFWLMTPLVSEERQGRVERDGGATATVTLLPSGAAAGSGSQLSLAAMRALDIPITDLVTLKVYSD